jgi:hypothetical protein
MHQLQEISGTAFPIVRYCAFPNPCKPDPAPRSQYTEHEVHGDREKKIADIGFDVSDGLFFVINSIRHGKSLVYDRQEYIFALLAMNGKMRSQS